MEYRDDLFRKMPFYMTYPMQNLYLTEMEYEKDMERMKQLYPKEVWKLQQMIERRCDEMEYDGSRMYDENPDRYMLEREAKHLLEKFIGENPQYESNQEYTWIRSLIEILFHDEIYRRRCRHRRCSRWW
ncbi:MAG: hypothetical protein IKJ16_05175 [Agathobacter sp.]|nr:hypothetical protein [Agathobacter sp.]